jgi:site-specific DNA recombinase
MEIALSYSRISDPNDKREASLETQEAAIVAFLEAKGYVVPPELRFREQYTGMESIHERPILSRARDLVAEGRISAFGVYDTDRLARDPQQLIVVVGDNHRKVVETIFVKLDVETKSRIGEAILYIKGLASALEADAIRDRTMRGRMAIYKKGQVGGYGHCRYGYLRDRETKTRTPDPETAPIVVRIFESIAKGIHPAELCRQLTVEGIKTPRGKSRWTTSGLRVIITEKTYYGKCEGRRTMSTGIRRGKGTVRQVKRPESEWLELTDARTTPLVSEDLWEEANNTLKRFSSGKRPAHGKNSRLFMLSGRVWCKCGHRMTYELRHHRTGKSRCYRCTGGSPTRSNPNGCRTSLGATKLEEGVWKVIANLVRTAGTIEPVLVSLCKSRTNDDLKTGLETAEARKRKVLRSVISLADAIAEAEDSRLLMQTLKPKIAELDRESDELDSMIDDLRKKLASQDFLDTPAARIKRAISRLRDGAIETMDMTSRRDLLAVLDARVTASTSDSVLTIDDRFDEASAG